MDCKQLRKKLLLYLYGELTEKDILPLKSHLKTCRRCKAEFHSLRNTMRLISQNSKFTLPLWYRRRLLDKISTRLGLIQERRVIYRKPALVFGTVAATLIIAISTLFLLNIQPSSLHWEDYGFTYEVDQLDRDIGELSLALSAVIPEPQEYSFEESLEVISQEIEELENLFQNL